MVTKPSIAAPEREATYPAASLASYIAAALLMAITLREAVLLVRPVAIAKATISK
jgi:hypothetical protein